MNTKKTIFALIVIIALIAAIMLVAKQNNTNKPYQQDDAEIVATVGKEIITSGELKRTVQIFQQNPQTQSVTEDQILTQLINQKLLYQKAIANGFESNEEDLSMAYDQALLNFGSEEALETELGFSTEDFKKFLTEQLTTQAYVNSLRESFDVEISNDQIQTAFEEFTSQTEGEFTLEDLQADILQYLKEQAFQEYLTGEIETLQDEYTVEIVSDNKEEMVTEETISEDSIEMTEETQESDTSEELVEEVVQ